MTSVRAVAFDCDGVLADAGSSWAVIHSHFGTGDQTLLDAFLKKEITDEEFMRDDIRQWKEKQPKIHRDELFRFYSGVRLMEGAREVVSALMERGIHVVIISAGVDLFVSAIASMLKVDDWAANGFSYDQDGFLMDEGVCRVPAWNKGEMVEKLIRIHGFDPSEVVSVGDNSMDLSMFVSGSRFIGFNPAREEAYSAFHDAGVPIVPGPNLRDIWPVLFEGEEFPMER
jgi:phosphoserine phosphatase